MSNKQNAKITAYRNAETGETAPPHLLGTDAKGRPLYQGVEGWEPVEPYHEDADGNWVPAGTLRLEGREAIEYAREHGLALRKYADPVEDARDSLTVDEAEEVAAEDPSLVYLDRALDIYTYEIYDANPVECGVDAWHLDDDMIEAATMPDAMEAAKDRAFSELAAVIGEPDYPRGSTLWVQVFDRDGQSSGAEEVGR